MDNNQFDNSMQEQELTYAATPTPAPANNSNVAASQSDSYVQLTKAQPDSYAQMNQAQPDSYAQMNQAQSDAYAQLTQPQPDPYAQMNQAQPNPYAQMNQAQPNPYAQMNQGQPNPYAQMNQAQPNPYGQSSYAQDPYAQMAGYNGFSQNGYNPNASIYQQQTQVPAKPVAANTNIVYTPEQIKKARLLCIISLICYVSPVIISVIFSSIDSTFLTLIVDQRSYNSAYNIFDYVSTGALLLSLGAHIAGIVLMIIARVKYPKFTFAKVLMWIYIGFAILMVISLILLMLFFYWICSQCV